jgi:hypothetical protein
MAVDGWSRELGIRLPVTRGPGGDYVPALAAGICSPVREGPVRPVVR